MAGASSLLSNAGSVAGPAGGHSSWPSASRASSARSAASAPGSPSGGSIQASSAPRCWSSSLDCPVAQCRASTSVSASSSEEPGTRARSPKCVSHRPSNGTRGRRRMRRLRVLLGGTPEAHGAPEQPYEVDARAARQDQLRGVRAQLDLDLDALAGLRVGLAALGGLHDVGVRVDVRQDDVRQLGQEREPQVAVARLRHDQQPGRVPVGADQRAERGAGLTGGGERHEDQRPVGRDAGAGRWRRAGRGRC